MPEDTVDILSQETPGTINTLPQEAEDTVEALPQETQQDTTDDDTENFVAAPAIDKENKSKSDDSESEDESTVTETYIVENILDKRIQDSEWVYLIKWQGWPSYTNTWEPKRNLLGCGEKLKAFEEIWGKKQKFKRERALLEERENIKRKEEESKSGKVEPDLSAQTAAAKPKAKKRRRRY